MPRFTKRPITIDAWQIVDCRSDDTFQMPAWMMRAIVSGDVSQDPAGVVSVQTLEGVMTGRIGDWVIRGTKGDLYPCKADIFIEIYGPADEPGVAVNGLARAMVADAS